MSNPVGDVPSWVAARFNHSHGPLILAHRAWREAHAALDTETARWDLLQSGVDHFTTRLSTLPNHDPQRFDVHHAVQVLTVGLGYDHGSVRTPLVQWCEQHGGLHILSGGGAHEHGATGRGLSGIRAGDLGRPVESTPTGRTPRGPVTDDGVMGSFTLGDIVGAVSSTAPPAPPAAEPVVVVEICPSGKRCLPTKQEVKHLAYLLNIQHQARRPMRPYRCEFGNHWHLGHRRGTASL